MAEFHAQLNAFIYQLLDFIIAVKFITLLNLFTCLCKKRHVLGLDLNKCGFNIGLYPFRTVKLFLKLNIK